MHLLWVGSMFSGCAAAVGFSGWAMEVVSLSYLSRTGIVLFSKENTSVSIIHMHLLASNRKLIEEGRIRLC